MPLVFVGGVGEVGGEVVLGVGACPGFGEVGVVEETGCEGGDNEGGYQQGAEGEKNTVMPR